MDRRRHVLASAGNESVNLFSLSLDIALWKEGLSLSSTVKRCVDIEEAATGRWNASDFKKENSINMATPGPSASVHFLFCFSLFLFPTITRFRQFGHGLTGFYLVFLGFTGIHWVFTGFLTSFTGFYWYLLGFYRVLLGFSELYWVLPSFPGFYGYSMGFYRVLPSFT